MSRNARFTALGLVMILSLVLGALLAQPIAAQGDALATCDPTVRALVWAARDAYGYDWTVGGGMTGGATGGQDTTGDTGNAEATPEATESTKLTVMKINPAIQQDGATPEPTAEASGEDTTQAQQPAAPSVNCDAIRADVVAFIFAQNNVSVGAPAGGMTFTVDGVAYTPNFHVLMSGPQEVPGPGDADGQGEAWLWIDSASNTVCWSMVTAGIAIPASAAHIHVGAEGESGGVVVPLSAPGADGAASGCNNEAEGGVIDAILANPSGYYVNVHTNEHPDGAIRGQLLGAGS